MVGATLTFGNHKIEIKREGPNTVAIIIRATEAVAGETPNDEIIFDRQFHNGEINDLIHALQVVAKS